MTASYRSSTAVPTEAFQRFSKRAASLRIGILSLAKQVLALAEEGGYLPESPGASTESPDTSSFKFSLPEDFVEHLGGEDRARELLRWAIVEGLDKSPLAAPEKRGQ